MANFFTASMVSGVGAAAIGQSFSTEDSNVTAGAIMSLKKDSPNTVQLANRERAEEMLGVVSTDPLIALTDGKNKAVQVVTSGVTGALVSDINGDIKTGDKITASPIDGVGMKATTSSVALGTAQADLSNVSTTKHNVTDKDGKTQEVTIGIIPVQVNVSFYSPATDSLSFLPAFLHDFAKGIAGKDVSPVRVLIAATILVLAFISIAVLLYASVRSSIISIGRNPLSEVSVRKGLLQIGAIGVAILLLTLITIYLILTT